MIDSRKAGPGALFAALPGERVDGHDFAGAAVAAGAVAVLGTRPVGVPALLTPDVPAALAKLARAVTDALPGLCHRRHHRVRGQDDHQGPGRAAGRAAGPHRRAARVLQQRDRPSADGAAGHRGRPGTWSWSSPPAGPGTSRSCARSRRPASAWCCAWGTPTPVSSAGSRRSPAPRGSCPPPCRRRGGPAERRRPAGARDGGPDRRQGGHLRPGQRRHGARGGRPARRLGPRGVHPGDPGGVRAGAVAPVRRAQRDQRAGRGGACRRARPARRRGRGRPVRGGPAQPVADGGHRARRTG